MVLFREPLAVFGSFVFMPLQFNKRLELLFVMILFPGILNCIYFWIADSFLKAKSDSPGGAHETSFDESGKADPLLTDIAKTEIVMNAYSPAPWSALAAGKQEANIVSDKKREQFV